MPASRRRRPRQHDGTSAAEEAVFRATEGLLETTPFADITVARILENAGISRANFYHYFASKYDVLAALLLRLGGEAESLARQRIRPPERISTQLMETVLEQSLDLWRAHTTVLCAASEWAHEVEEISAAWADMRRRFVEPMTEHLTRDRAAAGLPDHGDAGIIATLLSCGIERTLYITRLGLEPRLPASEDAFAPLMLLARAAVETAVPITSTASTAVPAPDTDAAADDVAPATDQAILDALADLLLDTPVQDVSVARILERAHVSRATFYFYFASKADAFLALYRQVSERLVSSFVVLVDPIAPAGSAPTPSTDLVRPWLAMDARTRAVFRNAVHEWTRHPLLRDGYLAHARTMTAAIEHALTVGREAGVVPPGPPVDQLAATVLWTVERAIAGALVGEDHLADLDRVADVSGALVGAALLPSPDR